MIPGNKSIIQKWCQGIGLLLIQFKNRCNSITKILIHTLEQQFIQQKIKHDLACAEGKHLDHQ